MIKLPLGGTEINRIFGNMAAAHFKEMISQRKPKAPNRVQPSVHQAPCCTKATPKKCAQDVQWNEITLIGSCYC